MGLAARLGRGRPSTYCLEPTATVSDVSGTLEILSLSRISGIPRVPTFRSAGGNAPSARRRLSRTWTGVPGNQRGARQTTTGS